MISHLWADVSSVPSWIWWVILAHAINTCPTSESNVWLQWALGLAKFAVGQRISGANALHGMQTEVTAVTKEQKQLLANGSKMEVIKTPSIVSVTPVETVIVEKKND